MPTAPAQPAWVLENETAPIRLMNTLWADASGVHDALETPADLAVWLASVRPTVAPPFTPTSGELGEARLLREGLRRLAAVTTTDPRPIAQGTDLGQVQRALVTVNTWARRRGPDQLTLDMGRLSRTRPAPGSLTEDLLASVAAEAVEMLAGARAARLRACEAPGCVLYFSAGHPRRAWCSEACGNRARAARHYARVRASRDTPASGQAEAR